MIFDIIKLVWPIFDRLIPDTNARAEAKELLEKTLLDNQAALMQSMASVMAADAASESWMTRNARPVAVFWCLGMMTWVVLSPIFGLQAETIKSIRAIPSELWNMSAAGIGAYILGKSITDAAKAYKK